MVAIKKLTKSDFLRYLECPYQFYQSCIDPAADQGVTESDQLAIENGKSFQKEVYQLLGDVYDQEYVFNAAWAYSRTDLVRHVGENTVQLYEVKSSKFKSDGKIDDQYLYDIAFQKWVAEAAGYEVAQVYLILANEDYVFDGTKHTQELFTVVEVSDIISDLIQDIQPLAENAYAIKSEHTLPLSDHACSLKSKCAYLKTQIELPKYHIGTLPRIRTNDFWSYLGAGVISLDDISDLDQLTKGQRSYVESYIQKEPIFDEHATRAMLETMAYPLYFLDYETYAPSVPIMAGYKSYEKIPFQYSLHVLKTPNGKIEHHEFLLEALSDHESLVASLHNHIGDHGHVVVWNKSFEASCNQILANQFPAYKSFLEWINDRLFDLEDFFKWKYFVDHRFMGKTSIKYVLPVLAPHLSYDDLDINNGLLASYRWKKAFIDNDSRYPKDKTKRALLQYCEQDSVAMYEIYKKLTSIV